MAQAVGAGVEADRGQGFSHCFLQTRKGAVGGELPLRRVDRRRSASLPGAVATAMPLDGQAVLHDPSAPAGRG